MEIMAKENSIVGLKYKFLGSTFDYLLSKMQKKEQIAK